MKRQRPPGLTSISWIVFVKPFGPHQCTRCFGSVHALNTSSLGALMMREMTISQFADSLTGLNDHHLFLLI